MIRTFALTLLIPAAVAVGAGSAGADPVCHEGFCDTPTIPLGSSFPVVRDGCDQSGFCDPMGSYPIVVIPSRILGDWHFGPNLSR